MKKSVQIILAMLLMLTIAHAGDGMLPPEELRGKWEDLQKLKFKEWSIKEFHGWDVPLDGGSKVFFFENDGGDRFDLMVANLAYWTAEDNREGRQVFIVIHKNRFYRIDPKSEEEKNMLEKLTDAAARLRGEGKTDPKLLTGLAERLKSREPLFKPKG